METYVYRRLKNGTNLIDLKKTWEKAMVAARIIAAVQANNKSDVLVSFTSALPCRRAKARTRQIATLY